MLASVVSGSCVCLQLREWKGKFDVQTSYAYQAGANGPGLLEVRGLRDDMDIVVAEGSQLIGKQREFASKRLQVTISFSPMTSYLVLYVMYETRRAVLLRRLNICGAQRSGSTIPDKAHTPSTNICRTSRSKPPTVPTRQLRCSH